MPESESDLVPLQSDSEATGFDMVLRGYDRRQVDDYCDRVDAAMHEADQRHAEDGERLQSFEQEVAQLRTRLEQAEKRAAGQPEPASLVGERLARMLALAEEEAAALRASAREDADRMHAEAREASEREHAARTAQLEQRERDIEGAAAAADQIRLEAQRDAEVVRDSSRREADQLYQRARAAGEKLVEQANGEAEAVRASADEDSRRVHEASQAEAAQMTSEARRQVGELSRQRDGIAQQLQSLRDAVQAAVGPLTAPSERQAP